MTYDDPTAVLCNSKHLKQRPHLLHFPKHYPETLTKMRVISVANDVHNIGYFLRLWAKVRGNVKSVDAALHYRFEFHI
jgi:hypothetical protein